MNIKEIKELFSDEAFVKTLFAMETVEEVQEALKEKGLEATEEELLNTRDFLGRMADGTIPAEKVARWQEQLEEDELPEDLLEQVSGGGLVITSSMVASMGVGAGVAGLAVGAVVAGGALALSGLIAWAIVKRW